METNTPRQTSKQLACMTRLLVVLHFGVASPPLLPPSTASHRRVLERPPSPSLDRPMNQPLLLDPDAHLRSRQGGSCAIHS
jgi:hypothetical protein